MKVQSIELISRYTQTSSRLLWIMSGGVLLIARYDLNSKAWDFLGRSIKPEYFQEIATVVLFFLMVSHFINWISDRAAYSRWFQTNEVVINDMGAIGSFRGSTTPMIEATFRRFRSIEKTLDDLQQHLKRSFETQLKDESTQSDKIEDRTNLAKKLAEIEKYQSNLERELKELRSMLEDIGPGFRKVSWFAFFVIYIWYFTFPILAALGAAFSLWQTDCRYWLC